MKIELLVDFVVFPTPYLVNSGFRHFSLFRPFFTYSLFRRFWILSFSRFRPFPQFLFVDSAFRGMHSCIGEAKGIRTTKQPQPVRGEKRKMAKGKAAARTKIVPSLHPINKNCFSSRRKLQGESRRLSNVQ